MGNSDSKQQRSARESEDVVNLEIETVRGHTTWSRADLREYHAAFMAQYPTGTIDKETFIAENIAINGGCRALWAHVYRLIGCSHPLSVLNNRFVAVDPHGRVSTKKTDRSGRTRYIDEANEDDDVEQALKKTKEEAGEDADSSTSFEMNELDPEYVEDDNDDDDGVHRQRREDHLMRSRVDAHGGEELYASENAKEDAGSANNATAAGKDFAAQARLRTSYVASVMNSGGPMEAPGMTFSHVMLRLYRAQYAPAEKKMKYLFALFDLNHDGIVDVHEITTVLSWLYELDSIKNLKSFQHVTEEERNNPRLRAKALMKIFDRDADGLLTQDEFVESCRMDTGLLDMFAALHKTHL